jgi:hypothetical protein
LGVGGVATYLWVNVVIAAADSGPGLQVGISFLVMVLGSVFIELTPRGVGPIQPSEGHRLRGVAECQGWIASQQLGKRHTYCAVPARWVANVSAISV